MTQPYKQLTDAATLLEKSAEALDAAATQDVKSAKELAAAKTATTAALKQAKTATAVKPAELDKAKLGGLAKTAAESLRESGFISSAEQADIFAAEVLDPAIALQKIAQLAKVASVPKRAEVILEPEEQVAESADSRWEKTAMAHLKNFNLG